MKPSFTPLFMILGILLFLCGGCSSMGVKKRISEKSDVFETLTPQQQKTIRAGFIEKGFSKDMVYIALGKPSKTTSKNSPLGMMVTWIYKNYYGGTDLVSIKPIMTSANKAGIVSQSMGGNTRWMSNLSIDDAPTDTLYVVFIAEEVYGITLESQGGPVEL